MGKRGPQAKPALTRHKGTGQWYRRVDGQRKYFGTDEAAAYRRWHEWEAQRVVHHMTAQAEAEQAEADRRIEQLTPARKRELENASPLDYVRLSDKYPSARPGEVKVITCEAVKDYYLADIKRHCGIQHYLDAKRRLRHWIKFVGRRTDIRDLTPKHFERYRDRLFKEFKRRKEWEARQPKPVSIQAKQTAPGIAGSSFNKHVVLVKGAFNRIAEKEGIHLSEHVRCMRQLKQVTANKQDVVIFTKADIAKMLESDAFDLKWKTIVVFGLNVAGSNIDVARATWHHVRFDLDTIEYVREKSQHIRRFPLWKSTRALLLKWRQECPSTIYMFTTTHGRPLIDVSRKNNRKDSLGQQFRKRMETLGLPQSFNAIRKSVASIAPQYGANELVVKIILGDAPNEVWRGYGQSLPQTIREAMDGVARHFGLKP